MSSKEKEIAKIEKKRLKAQAKIAKKKFEMEKIKASVQPVKEPVKKVIEVKHTGIPEHKSWKDNIWLYFVVAIVIVVIGWFIQQALNYLFRAQ